jgi:hypothetical protein
MMSNLFCRDVMMYLVSMTFLCRLFRRWLASYGLTLDYSAYFACYIRGPPGYVLERTRHSLVSSLEHLSYPR